MPGKLKFHLKQQNYTRVHRCRDHQQQQNRYRHVRTCGCHHAKTDSRPTSHSGCWTLSRRRFQPLSESSKRGQTGAVKLWVWSSLVCLQVVLTSQRAQYPWLNHLHCILNNIKIHTDMIKQIFLDTPDLEFECLQTKNEQVTKPCRIYLSLVLNILICFNYKISKIVFLLHMSCAHMYKVSL